MLGVTRRGGSLGELWWKFALKLGTCDGETVRWQECLTLGDVRQRRNSWTDVFKAHEQVSRSRGRGVEVHRALYSA